MLFKIFLFVLLLACANTYTLKTIKDNKDTNFLKLRDNFNLELNLKSELQPELRPSVGQLKGYLGVIFGKYFLDSIKKYLMDEKEYMELFDKDILSKLKEKCTNIEE